MNIYVGNLSYEVTENDLQKSFEAFGKVVTVKIIKDPYTDSSKGFGFVEMSTKEEADAAVAELNGKELKGRTLKVNEAHARNEKRRPTNNNRGGGGGDRARNRY
ncbi:MAG: RNA-binding protein [Spirochaetota bacterium]|nr:RNA-binding protein [Spirochaetota bacterium]